MSNETLTLDDARLAPAGDLDGPRSKALIAGVIGVVATVAGYFLVDPDVFFRSYLLAFVYWLGLPLGMLMLCMLTHVSGGRWGIQMHRVFLVGARTLPAFAVVGLPILFLGGMQELYPWTTGTDALVEAKSGYLKMWFDFQGTNPEWMTAVPGFAPRYFLYFLIWSVWAFRLSSLARQHDETGDPAIKEKAQKWSAGGLVVFFLVGTFYGIDWLMSTDPHWFSSLYGPQVLLWQGFTALCFAVPVMVFLGDRRPLDRFIRRKHYHDYGKLMLAFTMVWGYFSVSQFLIIWSGNLPEEVGWYLARDTEAWKYFTIGIAFFAFVVPFLILLSQDIKFKPRILVRVAILILVVRWFDYLWQVGPNMAYYDYHPLGGGTPSAEKVELTLGLFDLAPMLAMGGLWTWYFLGQLKDRVIVPIHELEIKEALADG